MRCVTKDEKETFSAGREFSALLKSGDIVALFGGLGAGKTCFMKGLAAGLGILEHVTSPTFSILNEYQGNMPLYHFDMYRVLDSDSLYDIGFFDYLDLPGICAIEWSENISAFLPLNHYRVEITRGEEENERIISITGPCP